MPGILRESPSPPLDPVAVSEDLTPLPTLKPKGDTDITFDGQLSVPLKYHEDVRSGCGGQTWPAGMVMGKHLLRYHREDLQNARILELGAGGGLVGLAIALECGVQHQQTGNQQRTVGAGDGAGDGDGHPILITDQLPMLDLMRHNTRLNHAEGRVKPLILNWGEPLPQQVLDQKPNVIIAAECVYFEPAFPLLMQTLKDLFELNEDAVVYFCFKKRRRADLQFVKRARKVFAVEEMFDEDRPIFSRKALFLFSFRSRRATGKPQTSSRKMSLVESCSTSDSGIGDT